LAIRSPVRLLDVTLEIEFSPAPDRLEGDLKLFVLYQGSLLVSTESSTALLPSFGAGMASMLFPGDTIYLGRLRGQHCCAIALSDQDVPPSGYYPENLRRLIHLLSRQEFIMASRALQLLNWQRHHRYCSRCGTPTAPHASDKAMVCPSCEYTQYPRITPCIITLIRREDRVLLAHGAGFPPGMFSCLAGFMEPGEDVEHAVQREVWEETRLRIGNLRYHGSQSWPFPHSLMLAFHADYLAGEIVVDGEEVLEADWFTRQQLPQMPPAGSISRSLIDSWLGGEA
jgi:NAD+ diphosphatase